LLWVSFARKDTPHQAPIRNCAWRFEVGKVRVLQLVSYKTGAGAGNVGMPRRVPLPRASREQNVRRRLGAEHARGGGPYRIWNSAVLPGSAFPSFRIFVSVACDSYRGVLAAWAVMFVLIYTHTNASGLLSQHYCCALLFYRLLSGYCLSL